ncbi:MAG: hypothetical protein KGI67_03700 [Pseudomonadota bacterium]|nr:hypothetical protein [Pseudomonadota bacterium]
MNLCFPSAVLLAGLAGAAGAAAGDLERSTLPADHPLVGTWRIDLPQVGCHELYVLRADGTGSVSSGQEQGENEFQLAAEPDAAGFYKWVGRVTADNGKPDCMGNVTPVGDTSTTWIHLFGSGQHFLLCFEPTLRRCIGPFVRQQAI